MFFMTKKQETFASLMESFRYRYEIRSVFNDFLTLSLAALARNYATGQSEDEELYMTTIAKYKDDPLRFKFPEAFALLITEMSNCIDSGLGNDVLGSYYEQHLFERGKSQFFTPWPICQFMARTIMPVKERETPLRILDPCCGSGRTLLAGALTAGREHEYYGIDIDHTCAQMTALNLFLNGIFDAEVMCADALMPDDFRVSYKTSFLPLGVYRITDKEKSKLWHTNKNSFDKKPYPSGQVQLRFF